MDNEDNTLAEMAEPLLSSSNKENQSELQPVMADRFAQDYNESVFSPMMSLSFGSLDGEKQLL